LTWYKKDPEIKWTSYDDFIRETKI